MSAMRWGHSMTSPRSRLAVCVAAFCAVGCHGDARMSFTNAPSRASQASRQATGDHSAVEQPTATLPVAAPALTNPSSLSALLCVGQPIDSVSVEREARRTQGQSLTIGPLEVFWAKIGHRCWAAELDSDALVLSLTSDAAPSIAIGLPRFVLELSYRHVFEVRDGAVDPTAGNFLRTFQLPRADKPFEDSAWIRCGSTGYHQYRTFETRAQCERF